MTKSKRDLISEFLGTEGSGVLLAQRGFYLEV